MICHITARVAHLYETVEFYQWLLGLPISMKLNTPDGEIIFLGDNETKLELIEDKNAETINAKGLTIGFTVDSLDDKIKMLDSKQIPHSTIISPSPNISFIFFNDHNGCEIQLCEEKK
jgi:lactoylglutathione lyase